MCVGVEGESGGEVAQHTGHCLDVHPVLQSQCCEGVAQAVADAFRYSKVVLATTTYNGSIFPFMREFIDHLTERNFSNRTVAFIENGSWAPTAVRVMKKMLEPSKDLCYTDTTVTIVSALNAKNAAQLNALAHELHCGSAAEANADT